VLQELRDDVRAASYSSSSEDNGDDHHHRRRRHCDDDDDFFVSVFGDLLTNAALYTLTSPRWAPQQALGDDLSAYDALCFPRFPYDRVRGHMMRDPLMTCQGQGGCSPDNVC
jgi:hypothetical protein